MKVMTVVGTRPEIIRLSRVIAKLTDSCDHVFVHTGQNYDPLLNDIFLSELGLPQPDVQFVPDRTSLGSFLGSVLSGTEAAIEAHRPDVLLVLGDTNSCLAALIARRMGVTVFHMEAGNRCWDLAVPEETNRRVVDHVSDFNLVYSEHARRNLLREGMHPRKVYLTGSPMREVLDHYAPHIAASTVLKDMGLKRGGYMMASLHREESVDTPEVLTELLEGLDLVSREHDVDIIVSTHPRTRKRLDTLGIAPSPRLVFSPPFGFFDYIALQANAKCVISDSGTISEESLMLGFAAVTPRNAIERPESLDVGGPILCGTQPKALALAVRHAALSYADGRALPNPPAEYAITDTSERVVRLITGLSHLRRMWDGLAPDSDG